MQDAREEGLEVIGRWGTSVQSFMESSISGIRITCQQMCLVLLEDDQILQLSRRDDLFGGCMIGRRIVSGLLAGLPHFLGRLVLPHALAHDYVYTLFFAADSLRISASRNFKRLCPAGRAFTS